MPYLSRETTALVRPFLEELRDATEESTTLAILQDGMVSSLTSVDSRHPLRMSIETGRKSPIHATGIGKAIVAFLPESEQDRLIGTAPLQRFTPTTISDPQQLRVHLRRVRQLGYAMDELSEQLRCVAAPIFDAHGKVAAAISVSGPVFRMTLDRLQEFSFQVTRCAAAISVRLGHRAAEGLDEGAE